MEAFMNIRALVLSVLGLSALGYYTAGYAMDDMANQQAMMMAMIKHMPEEKIREMAESHFAGDMHALRSDVSHNVRWAALETALALLVFDGASESLSKKIVAGCLATFSAFEMLGALANSVKLWNLSSEQEALYRHLMNIRAGSQMHDEALDEDMLNA